VAQCIGTLTCIVFVFVSFYVFFKLVDKIIGNRVSAEVELQGLDLPEMGALAYPEFQISPAHRVARARRKGRKRANTGGAPRPRRAAPLSRQRTIGVNRL
jgi:hypothetical protein